MRLEIIQTVGVRRETMTQGQAERLFTDHKVGGLRLTAGVIEVHAKLFY
jgi:hypothetical protein